MIYTKNLNLFKWDMTRDLEEQFSITSSLNNNWDKIDAYAKRVNDNLTEINETLRHFRIGDPIIRLSNAIDDTIEVRLEGGELEKAKFPELFAVYGTKYGTPSNSKMFILPNFKNRSFCGYSNVGGTTSDPDPYLAGILPRIYGQIIDSNDFNFNDTYRAQFTGAFKFAGTSRNARCANDRDGASVSVTTFDASRCSPVYSSTTDLVRPTSVKVRVVTRYK